MPWSDRRGFGWRRKARVVAYSVLLLSSDFLSPESQVVLGVIALTAVAWTFAPERKR